MKKFTELKRGALVVSLIHRSTDECIADAIKSEADGADGFILHAERLDEKYRTPEEIAKIQAATSLPVMVLNYRTEDCRDDAKLNDLKLGCARLGLPAVDVPIYSFDEGNTHDSLTGCTASFAAYDPNEVSMNPAAIEKQKELIGKCHELGCEVLMSAHIGKVMPKEETLALAREIESRGADIVKIIANAKNEEELCIVLCTINYLKNNMKTPFLYQTCGKYGKFVRPTAFMFGSCMVLCNDEIYEMSNPEKPLMRDVNKIKRLLMWED